MYHCGCKSKIKTLGSKIKIILNFKDNCSLMKFKKKKKNKEILSMRKTLNEVATHSYI